MCARCFLCRICHCEGGDDCPLIMPCRCTGSLSFVHQGCLNQWIKSSDTRCCELCKFDFVMETKLKPLRKVGMRTQTAALLQPGGPLWAPVGSCGPMWAPVGPCGLLWAPVGPCGPLCTNPTPLSSVLQWEKLHMSKSERRKIFSSVLFHLLAIVCMMLPVYVLVKRTAEEIRLGKNGQYITLHFFLTLTMHVTVLTFRRHDMLTSIT